MTSSIDTIRRLAGLSPGEYTIPERKDMMITNNTTNNAKSKVLSATELEQYNVFPIIRIKKDEITYVVNPESVSYNESKFDTSKLNKEDINIISRREIDIPNGPNGDHIVIICRDSSDSMKLPTANFWCESVNSDYISNVTQAQPLLDSYQGRFLWYYGIKKPKKGGHPRRRGTFRQRRFKRTTSKSRRRATRRTHRRV